MAFPRKSRSFHSDQIDPANFSRVTVRNKKGRHVLDNLGATASDGEPANSAKLMHRSEPAHDSVITDFKGTYEEYQAAVVAV